MTNSIRKLVVALLLGAAATPTYAITCSVSGATGTFTRQFEKATRTPEAFRSYANNSLVAAKIADAEAEKINIAALASSIEATIKADSALMAKVEKGCLEPGVLAGVTISLNGWQGKENISYADFVAQAQGSYGVNFPTVVTVVAPAQPPATVATTPAPTPIAAPGPDFSSTIRRLEGQIEVLEARPIALLTADQKSQLASMIGLLKEMKAAQAAAEAAQAAAEAAQANSSTNETSAADSATLASGSATLAAGSATLAKNEAAAAKRSAEAAKRDSESNSGMWKWIVGLGVVVFFIIVVIVLLWWRKADKSSLTQLQEEVDGLHMEVDNLHMELPDTLVTRLKQLPINTPITTEDKSFHCGNDYFALTFTKVSNTQVTVAGVPGLDQVVNIDGIVSTLKRAFRRCYQSNAPLGVAKLSVRPMAVGV